MKHDEIRYTCRTVFDDAAIRLMFRTEYFTYEKGPLAMRCVFAVVLLLCGLFAGLPIAAQALCLLVGVWLLVALDFPSKIRAEGVIEQRHGVQTTVSLRFTTQYVEVEGSQKILYTQLDKLACDGRYLFLFQSKQNAVMVDMQALEPAQMEAFKAFIEEASGKPIRRSASILSMNLFDLLGIAKKKKKTS